MQLRGHARHIDAGITHHHAGARPCTEAIAVLILDLIGMAPGKLARLRITAIDLLLSLRALEVKKTSARDHRAAIAFAPLDFPHHFEAILRPFLEQRSFARGGIKIRPEKVWPLLHDGSLRQGSGGLR